MNLVAYKKNILGNFSDIKQEQKNFGEGGFFSLRASWEKGGRKGREIQGRSESRAGVTGPDHQLALLGSW